MSINTRINPWAREWLQLKLDFSSPIKLCAPFPGMEIPWTQEKIDELDSVLARYPGKAENEVN